MDSKGTQPYKYIYPSSPQTPLPSRLCYTVWLCIRSAKNLLLYKIRRYNTLRWLSLSLPQFKASAQVSKESSCYAGDTGSISGCGRSSGEGSDNPFQYSCQENPMDRGTWWVIAHGVARVRYNLATTPPAVAAIKQTPSISLLYI